MIFFDFFGRLKQMNLIRTSCLVDGAWALAMLFNIYNVFILFFMLIQVHMSNRGCWDVYMVNS